MPALQLSCVAVYNLMEDTSIQEYVKVKQQRMTQKLVQSEEACTAERLLNQRGVNPR